MNQVRLLLTYPEPSYTLDPTIKNDLGFNVLDYIERIKRVKDRIALEEMLQMYALNGTGPQQQKIEINDQNDNEQEEEGGLE